MHDAGEAEKGAIGPEFKRSVMIDFQGAKITTDVCVLMLSEVDERFDIIAPMVDSIDDSRPPSHTRHTFVQMIRQRVYQIASDYGDCNDADYLRIDPSLRLAVGKDHDLGAGQSMLSRLENGILGNVSGLDSLGEALLRSNNVILKRQDKQRLIIDLDSTEDPVYGAQENVAYNGYFGTNCFHPLFGEEVRRSLEWLIRRLIKVGTKEVYHSRRWHVQVTTSAFPLAFHYRAVFWYG